jgi:hypothetical protein
MEKRPDRPSAFQVSPLVSRTSVRYRSKARGHRYRTLQARCSELVVLDPIMTCLMLRYITFAVPAILAKRESCRLQLQAVQDLLSSQALSVSINGPKGLRICTPASAFRTHTC